MSIIPFIRFIGTFIVGGLLFWLFNNVLNMIMPNLFTSNVYFQVIHMMFSFFIAIILFNLSFNFLIEVRGRKPA